MESVNWFAGFEVKKEIPHKLPYLKPGRDAA